MLILPGKPGKDLCDRQLGVTRRDILRVGGSALLGLTLGEGSKGVARLARTGRLDKSRESVSVAAISKPNDRFCLAVFILTSVQVYKY